MDKSIISWNGFQIFIRYTRVIGLIIACLVFAGARPDIVRADIGIINPNNGTWDSNWGDPLYVDGDDAGVADDRDIDTFWVNTDAASPTTYYFGVSTISALSTSGGLRICIRMDCNGDGDVTDATDRVLEINPGDTIYDVIGNDSNTWEMNSANDGEFIERYYGSKNQ